MKLLAVVGVGAFLAAVLYRVFALQRKNPPTTAELRRKAFEHMAPRYHRTYDAKWSKLSMRIARRRQERAS